MKRFLLLVVIICFFNACKPNLNRNIRCEDFYEITFINRNGDASIPESLIIKNRDVFTEFCKGLMASKEIGRPNIKDHSGFYEILIGFKDSSKLRVYIIFTHYDGVVVRYRMKYYNNVELVELTEKIFRSNRNQNTPKENDK